MSRALRDNGLSIALFLLFLFSLAGHSIAGRAHYNDEARKQHQPELGYWGYLQSAAFAESVFENWESEFLQMAIYVVLTAFLFQRGSAESKDPDNPVEDVDEDPRLHQQDQDAPAAVRAGGWRLKLYENSLSIALGLLFLASFVLHLFSSAAESCRGDAAAGQPCQSWMEHLGGATFWFESFQNWQSEFLSIAAVVVLSIFLRQKGSPESKPVHSPHRATGR